MLARDDGRFSEVINNLASSYKMSFSHCNTHVIILAASYVFYAVSGSSNITMALPDTTPSKYYKVYARKSKHIYYVSWKNYWGYKQPLVAAKATMGHISSRG